MKEKNSNDKICKKLYSPSAMGKTYHCFTLARNLWFLFIYEYMLECDKSVSSLFISMPFISCPEVFWLELVKMFAWKTPPCTNKLKEHTTYCMYTFIHIHKNSIVKYGFVEAIWNLLKNLSAHFDIRTH